MINSLSGTHAYQVALKAWLSDRQHSYSSSLDNVCYIFRDNAVIKVTAEMALRSLKVVGNGAF